MLCAYLESTLFYDLNSSTVARSFAGVKYTTQVFLLFKFYLVSFDWVGLGYESLDQLDGLLSGCTSLQIKTVWWYCTVCLVNI